MKLYEEIIFLQYHCKGKYVVENVHPYYKPLIPAQDRARHLYWTNFLLPYKLSNKNNTALIQESNIKKLSEFHDYDFSHQIYCLNIFY